MTNDPLKQLGKYELSGVLGAGAMGVVYRAFDPVLNRYLAIKVMNAAIATDASLRERFLREARAAGSLQHPNVITIYDFGEADDHLFIAMEFVEGVDLAEIMARPDALPMPVRLEIIIDALNGLAYAHAHGLVHRDIKPANIRVTPDNRAKIMDFGIAHLQSSELTQSGVMIGTPQYMAPEQVVGGAVTPATDIFSVGTVLYELLSGAKPFTGETPHAVFFNVVSKNPRPVREIVPGLPPLVDAILAKALAKEPADRYPTALAMAKDLAKARTALMGPEGAESPEAATRTAEYRSHTTTAVRDPQLMSFIKGGGAPNAVHARARARARAPWIMAGSVTGVAVLVVLWMTTRNPGGTAAGSAAVSAAVSVAAPTTTSSVPTSGAPTTAANPGPTNSRPPNPGLASPTDAAARAPKTATPAPARATQATAPPGSARADSVLRSANLARGDSVARERTAPAEERPRAVAPPVALGVAPPPATRAETVSKPVPDPRPEIERVIASYARAIESGSVAEIRRAYPGLTAQQQQGWEGFFRSVRNFKATIVMDQLAVTGSNASAGVSAVYEYDNRTTGRADRQQLRLQATFNHEPAGWRLASVR